MEQIHARSLLPVSPFCIGISIRNGKIGIKSTEMIDPEHIIDFTQITNPGGPPPVTILFHIIPVKQWISPQLSISRKSIWRTSRHLSWPFVLIQLKQFRVCPHVHTVQRHIDRKISYNLKSCLIGIFSQSLPLFKEQILQAFPEFNLFFISGRCMFKGFLLPIS